MIGETMSLEGKNAVVTGGGSGIGRATALRLARDGAAVAVLGRTAASIEETVAMIAAAGGKAVACVADAAVKEDIEAALAKTHSELGPVSILINNAGKSPFCPFLDIDQEAFEDVLRVNVIGPFLCSQAVLPDMLAAKWGRIVNITSSITQDGVGTMAHYAASKSGLVGLTKAMAMEFAGTGITVNHIPVFFVETPMLHAAPLDLAAVADGTPAKRWGRAEEVAAACAYLVSDDAGYVTGQPLSLNGGRYLP
jgi:2-hydroxycyclohexanecarboxyl-CoA dehydrogenase